MLLVCSTHRTALHSQHRKQRPGKTFHAPLQKLTVMRTALQCPSQLITERELQFKVFANANALVPDPAAAFLAEDEVRPWSEAERRIFMEKFTIHPKVRASPSGEAMISILVCTPVFVHQTRRHIR